MRTVVAAALAPVAPASGAQRLAPDTARLAARIEACVHFAGDISGYRSVRDRDVARRMHALRCARVRADAGRLRHRHPRHAAVRDAMAAAAHL